MSQYIIMTDSSCDLPAQLAAELELEVLPLWDAHNPCQLYVMRI